MVASTRNSTQVTNLEASPRTMNDAYMTYGKKRVIMGTIETAAADDDVSYYTLAKLNAEEAVTSIRLFIGDAITGCTSAELGLYTGTTSASMTAASASCYASAVDISAANLTGSVATTYTDFAWEARDVALMGQKVYQDAGDALGDFNEYFLVLESSAVSTASTISFIIELAAE